MAHTIHTWPYINRKIKDPFFCCCCAWGRGTIYSNVTHKIWIWKCRFLRRGETRVPSDKPLGVRERTNNKLNPHMASTLGFEPGPHWWGASALTSSPPFFSVISQCTCYRIVDDKTNWLWQFFSHCILKAEDKIREGIEPLSKAANLFVKLKRYIEFIFFSSWRGIGEQLENQECLHGVSLADLWQLPWPKGRWLLV